jgi:hypothetical protein
MDHRLWLAHEKLLIASVQNSRLVSASAGVNIQKRGGYGLCSVRAYLVDDRAIDKLAAGGIGANNFNLKLHVVSALTLELSKPMPIKPNRFQRE